MAALAAAVRVSAMRSKVSRTACSVIVDVFGALASSTSNGRRAQVSSLTIGCSQRCIARPGNLADQLPQQRSANLQGALIEGRKRPPGEKDCRKRGVFGFARMKVLGNHCDLLGLLSSGAIRSHNSASCCIGLASKVGCKHPRRAEGYSPNPGFPWFPTKLSLDAASQFINFKDVIAKCAEIGQTRCIAWVTMSYPNCHRVKNVGRRGSGGPLPERTPSLLKVYTRGTSAYVLLITLLRPLGFRQQVKDTTAQLTIPDGTPIELRLVESVSSNHAHKGDRLNFIVVKDVELGGYTLVPAGTIARGTITQVKASDLPASAPRFRCGLDSVDLADGETLKLRASKVVKGGSRTKLMAGAMIATSIIFLPATPIFLLTRGRESTVVKTTEIIAQVEGPASVQVAGLSPSTATTSGLAEMMDYLPPRVFSGEGREGDMVNLIFVAQQKQLQDAFQRAGWSRPTSGIPSLCGT